ncbi:MAG: hypothetical protein LLF89_02525, partial [Spirochaetaceae bacterium]|nr:hypothetical protein [Spirochaetaceae bacterium]
YMIRELSAIVPMDNLVNATGIMIDPDQGLRNQLDIDEMAVLELAGTKSSRSVYNVLKGLRPGMSEIEASAAFCIDGDPLVSHPNLNFTLEGSRRGLVSPGTSVLSLGNVCNIGFGYRSSMVARTAFYAKGPGDLPAGWADTLREVFIPYFNVIKTWYESLAIGVSGKAIIARIRQEVPEFDELGVGLNPGHLIHNDEWTTSIFTEKGEHLIKNGMGIQCDIIASPRLLPGVHVEDGLAMADLNTRKAFKAKYPKSWRRIEGRRSFIKEVLGIRINDEVLPFSDIQGCLFPWMASLDIVLASV